MDRIVQRQLAVLDLQHHGNRGELLAHRPGLKDGRRSDRHAVFDIGDAIAADDFWLPLAHHDYRHARDALTFHLGTHKRIDACR